MTKEMISPSTNVAINKLVEKAFNGNAIFDNIAYNLDVVFNMPKASAIVHELVAHWLPAPFADSIQEFQSLRNVKPVRPVVEAQSKTYMRVVECFNDALNFFLEFEEEFKSAISIAEEEGDVASRIFLENTYMEILTYIKQMLVWSNKAIQYEENIGIQSFDIDIPAFVRI